MVDHAPKKVAQMARRVFDIVGDDDRAVALQGIAALRNFYRSIDMPTTLAELGVENPDFDTLVVRLHENKGCVFGGYMQLSATETRAIYELMK
jgi:alcohol dehydrogenase YqhD (iron-dependent ADH family)